MTSDAKRCLVCVDAGPGIGMGHLTRCIALSEALQEVGWSIHIAVNGAHSGRTDFMAALRGRGLGIETHPWQRDIEQISSNLSSFKAIVFDSYLPAEDYYRRLDVMRSESGPIFIFFDDTNRLLYPKGIVVNGSCSAEALAYPRRKGIMYLLGPQWQALRKEFWDVEPISTKLQADSIFITLGADDIRNLVPRLHLHAAERMPGFSQTILTTRFSRSFEELRSIVKSPHQLLIEPRVAELVEAMRRSDLAITAAGQSLSELSRLGVPLIPIKVADNQASNVAPSRRLGFASAVHNWDDPKVVEKVINDTMALASYGERIEAKTRNLAAIDGSGARRIARFIDAAIGG
jgi:spore coat polysaccharide biosynthesis predicted glycosyltransferase SpsG